MRPHFIRLQTVKFIMANSLNMGVFNMDVADFSLYYVYEVARGHSMHVVTCSFVAQTTAHFASN
jgi:putative component of toxin-antitoxin plasmid stabilization module